jgi:AAA+ ATPase superfamily predicted ATPase
LFIGRKKELNKLDELYNKDNFQFPIIYGRRRVGKTALINEFIKDKEVIFFTGIESNAQQNLENFSRSIFTYADEALENTVFPSFQAALEYVFKLAERKRIILVIDEYPYVAKASKSLASTIQSLIDKKGQLFLEDGVQQFLVENVKLQSFSSSSFLLHLFYLICIFIATNISHLKFYCSSYTPSFPKYYKSSRKRTFLHTFLQDGDYWLQLYER